jgi:multidrug efflux system membrane fusion protein
LHAIFGNEENRLWPGQFVRVSLTMDMIKDAVIIPERAVQEGIDGPYVYLAAKDGEHYRVAPQSVITDQGPDDFVAVLKGVAPGDLVITDGQLGLFPGALARVIE